MKKTIFTIQVISLIIIFSSCKKEVERYSDTPEITFSKMTPNNTTEFQDQVKITICYKDGDGDIGTNDPDEYSLHIKDKRLANYDTYHIKPLAPTDNKLQIEGELDVVLTGLFILDTSLTSQTTSFKIKLKDRAGNWSNEIETGILTINRTQ